MKPHDHDEDQQSGSFNPFAEFEVDTYRALLKDRMILFNGDVDKSVIERIVLPLTTMSQKSIKPIKLLINSSGGSVEDGQMVVDAILTSKAPIVTVALGKAMSAAFDIFLAGDRRVVYPNTVLMCHSGSARLETQTLPAINAEARLHEEYFKKWSKWYASRTKINEKEWYSLLNSGLNRYFFADECLVTGITHETIKISKKNLSYLFQTKNV